MERGNFIKQLIIWHDQSEHQHITDAVEKIPRNKWDFEISGLYARALNNLARFEDALDQLIMFEAEGREDGLWNFRVGYSLYYLNREEEAATYFQRAIDFGDDTEDTRIFLNRSLFGIQAKLLIMDAVFFLENGKQNIKEIQGKFDKIMREINCLRDKYLGNDDEIKKDVEELIREGVVGLVHYFNLNMGPEILMRKLD